MEGENVFVKSSAIASRPVVSTKRTDTS